MGLEDQTYFLGPRPFAESDECLAKADILVTTRTKGINTPMKVFHYLHSGRPVLLTELYTHSQVIPRDAAYLAPAESVAFSRGILELVGDEDLRARLGKKARNSLTKNIPVQHTEGGCTGPMTGSRTGSRSNGWLITGQGSPGSRLPEVQKAGALNKGGNQKLSHKD